MRARVDGVVHVLKAKHFDQISDGVLFVDEDLGHGAQGLLPAVFFRSVQKLDLPLRIEAHPLQLGVLSEDLAQNQASAASNIADALGIDVRFLEVPRITGAYGEGAVSAAPLAVTTLLKRSDTLTQAASDTPDPSTL